MKWLKSAVIFAAGVWAGSYWKKKSEKESWLSCLKSYKKYECLYRLMHQWRALDEMGIAIPGLLSKAGYRKIAIYGMADIGKHLYHALRGSEIEVCCGIDRGKSGRYEDIEIKKPEESLGEADAVIVTAVMDFEEIKAYLQRRTDCAVVSLEEILYEGAW